MATKWKDLKHKSSPEKRERLKHEAFAELDAIERSGVGELLQASGPQPATTISEKSAIREKS
jgi:hypothetical protein